MFEVMFGELDGGRFGETGFELKGLLPLFDGMKKFEFDIVGDCDSFTGILITPARGGSLFEDALADLAAGRGGLLGGNCLAGLPTSGIPKPNAQMETYIAI